MKRNSSWIPLILVSFASFVIALDATFMNVSITQICADLSTTVGTIQTTISFYTLITASLMLISAKLQDIVGKKKIFISGAIIYALGALIAAISLNSGMLFIGWAIMEGVGGALMTPAVISIVSGTYDGEMRTIALAIVSAALGIAAAIGPLFGGVVSSLLSWRYGFGFELIIILIIFLLRSKLPEFEVTESKEGFDIVGSILSVVGLILLVLGVLSLTTNLNRSVVLIILAVVILVLFALQEKRAKKPLFDVRLLSDRNLSVGTVLRLVTTLSLAGLLFAVSIFFQSILGFSAFDTGLNLLPLTVGMLISSLIASKLTMRFNHKLVICIGFVIAIIGALLLAYQFTLVPNLTTIAIYLFILGFGLGFPFALGVDIALINIPDESQNTSSGFVSTSQSLGMSMGTAIISLILIFGAVGGLHDATDMYAPDVTEDVFESNLDTYFDQLKLFDTTSVDSIDTVEESAVNTVIQDTMAFVMEITALIFAIGLFITLAFKDKKLRRKKA